MASAGGMPLRAPASGRGGSDVLAAGRRAVSSSGGGCECRRGSSDASVAAEGSGAVEVLIGFAAGTADAGAAAGGADAALGDAGGADAVTAAGGADGTPACAS